jgi:phage gp45-like
MSLASKIKNIISICRNDVYQDGKWKVSFLGTQAPTKIPQLQNFGFKSRPGTGNKAVMISRDGNPNAGIIIAIEDDEGAPSLAEGEVSVYNAHGSTIHLKADGSVQIDGGDVFVEGGDVLINSGDLVSVGDVQDGNATTPTMVSMRTLYNAHIHNISGAVTGPPTTQQ